MALVDNAFYVDSVGYTAITAWAALTAVSAGALRRQLAAPAVNSERVFVCVVAGTTLASEPSWTLTRGALTAEAAGPTWQECTGIAALNGDITNTPSWTISATPPGGVKNTAVTLGQVIKRDNGASYQICTVAGTAGNGAEPSFSDTAGTTTADNTVTWTSLGAVGNFTGGQASAARMTIALATTWAQAGNTIFVKSSHAVTQTAGLTLSGDSTIALPQRWICHNGGAYPPVAANVTTGASETSTSNSVIVQATGIYVEGITFAATAAAQSVTFGGANRRQKYKNCGATRAGTTGTIFFGFAGTGNFPTLEFDNPTFTFGNVGNGMGFTNGNITWRGGTLAGAAVPTTLINIGTNPNHTNLTVDGADLSALGAGKTIVGALGANACSGLFRFINCKLGASVVPAVTPGTPNYRVEFVNCDSGAINYDSKIYDYAGTLTTEITIVRSGGASDGVTPISWKIDTTANASFTAPFCCFPIPLWINSIGAPVTVTVQGIWGGGAVPTNADIWVEVEYLGSSATPISSFINDAKATVLSTAAAQDAGTGTWGGSTTKFALAVTFTPQMKGFAYVRVYCALASSTFYIDPKPILT